MWKENDFKRLMQDERNRVFKSNENVCERKIERWREKGECEGRKIYNGQERERTKKFINKREREKVWSRWREIK